MVDLVGVARHLNLGELALAQVHTDVDRLSGVLGACRSRVLGACDLGVLGEATVDAYPILAFFLLFRGRRRTGDTPC